MGEIENQCCGPSSWLSSPARRRCRSHCSTRAWPRRAGPCAWKARRRAFTTKRASRPTSLSSTCRAAAGATTRRFVSRGARRGWARARTFPPAWAGQPSSVRARRTTRFGDFSKVLLPYCDGASFTGNRATPVTVNGTTLHFGGKRILTQILKVLMGEPYNLGTAKEVLLTGCSAGGLATYLNADYVASLLPPSVERYKAAPISGFFLDVPSLTSVPVYPDEMRYVYHMQNCSVNAACVAAHAASPADCMFAEHSVAHIATPLFVQNSAYDSWQLNNIFLPQVSGWGACIHQVDNCTSQQIRVLNADWQTAFVRRVVQPDWFWRNTTGCFLHSVISHCLGDHDWNGPLRIDNVTVAQAWWNWYADATATNRHVGCTLNEKAPHQCAE